MARNRERGMASRPRRKRSPFLRLLLVTLIIALFWKIWSGLGEDGGSEPPPMAAYAEQPARNDWPPLQGSGNSFSAPVDRLKVNYYVILDGSARMSRSECSGGRSKMVDAVEALSSFVDSAPQGVNIGVSVLNDNRIMELLSLQSDGDLNTTMLSHMVPGGATPLRSAIHYAYKELISQGEHQLGYGEYHLVVISGGMATEGEDPAAVARLILSESPVNLHTIGFCSGAGHSLDQPGFISFHTVDNLAALKQGLNEVLAEAPSSTLDSFQEAVDKQ